eukprot:gene8093-9959_t
MQRVKTVLEEGTIPNSVKTLVIDHLLFGHDPKRIIPDSVENLIVDSFCQEWDSVNSKDNELKRSSIFNIPSSVKSLEFIDTQLESGHVPPIPSGITELKLLIEFSLTPGIFPQSLKSISMNYMDKQAISAGTIPSSLETLDLFRFKDPTQIFIPPSVKFIKLYIPYEIAKTPHDNLLQLITDLLSISNSKRELHFEDDYPW